MEDKIRRKKKRRWLILGSIVLLLIIFRLFLPTIVLHYVNKQLAQIPDYRGHVADIDISLYRGAYQIKGIELNKLSGKVQEPFFYCDMIDLSVQWGALFEGEVVGEIVFASPKITFVSGPTKEQSQTDIDSSWVDVVKDLIPLRINRLEIQNGEVHYKDLHSNPKVNLFVQNINALALNLSNSADSTKTLPSSVDATGNTLGKGEFTFHMDLNPLEEPTMFDLNAELKNVQMTELNDFLRAYANFDVSGGTFGLYTELASKNGQFEGYVKPVMKDLEVVEWGKKEEGSILQKAWETVIAAGTELLENRGKEKEQVATKVPLSGKMDNPQIDIFTTIGTLLKNAFIQALMPSIDESVNIGTVGGETEKKGLFGGKDKDEKGKDDKKGLFGGKDKDEKKEKKDDDK
jgi:hypothetical protein